MSAAFWLPHQLTLPASRWLHRRQRAVPPVCKRFAALCRSPDLLEAVRLEHDTLDMPKLRALCAWLARRAAGSAHVLDLWLQRVATARARSDDDDDAEALGSLTAAMAACAAAGMLEELWLDWKGCSGTTRLGSWTAGLRDLQVLSLHTHSAALEVTCSLAHLRHLDFLVRPAVCAAAGAAVAVGGSALPPQNVRVEAPASTAHLCAGASE